jgi:hypothetical protein
MPDNHICLFCGESIERTKVDPCTAVFAASSPDEGFDETRRARKSSSWWKRPLGQYWVHAACLRGAVHPSVPLQFLDLAESD